jgi:hypothetical protein
MGVKSRAALRGLSFETGEKFWKDFRAVNQREIMERSSVGNDDVCAHLFCDTAEAL